MSIQELSNQLAIDARDLNALKREARGNTAASNKAVARQFEALFLQTVLKSMRDATPHEGMFDSEQTRFYESMHDQQLTQVLATKGGGLGLAAIIEKQLNQMSGGGGGGGGSSGGSTAVVPEGLPPVKSALVTPVVAFLNEHGRDLPLDFQFVLNENEFSMMMSRPLPSWWIVNSGHMPESGFIMSDSSWMQNLG